MSEGKSQPGLRPVETAHGRPILRQDSRRNGNLPHYLRVKLTTTREADLNTLQVDRLCTVKHFHARKVASEIAACDPA